MNYRKRSAAVIASILASLALAIVSSSEAAAQTVPIGIRFILNDDLGKDAVTHQASRAKLEREVEELNSYYRNSGVVLQAGIVDIEFVRIEATDAEQILDDIAHRQNGFENVFEKADEFGADYTVVMRRNLAVHGRPGCGRAVAVNKTPASIASTDQSYAVINFACGAQTLAHELGHLMGLNHGFLVDQCRPNSGHTSAIAAYANGYAEGNCDGQPQPGEFGTIMVGGHMSDINGNNKGNLPIFSNPRIRDPRCGVKQICGNPVSGDEARALNENALSYAMHEQPDVHTLHYRDNELLACIEDKYHGIEIADLEELACADAGIGNIAGIEQLSALRRIDLSGNRIEDIGPLQQFRPDRVEAIDLNGNDRIACSALDRLEAGFPGKVKRPSTCLPAK